MVIKEERSNVKDILLLATGGTIASKHTEHGLAPQITSEEIIRYIPQVKDLCKVQTIQVCSIDSTNMEPGKWIQIVSTIKEHYDDFDGFVISHGTDTMAYTAAALSYLIQNSKKPIVITGSQKSIDVENTDGKSNLYDAFLYASADKSQGVVIAFDGKIIAGTRAKKVRSKSFNAFDSIDYPFLAMIQGDQILRYIPTIPYQDKVQFYERINGNICLMKLIPGITPFGLEEAFLHYDSIIVESFGVGGIPSTISDEFYLLHQKYPDTLIVMATQVSHEGSDMTVYEVGQKIKRDCDFLESYDMTLESVIAKTMWMLGNYTKREELEETFYKQINFDLIFDKNRTSN